MEKYKYLFRALFIGEIELGNKEKIVYELEQGNLLEELVPMLVRNKLVCHFYYFVTENGLVSFLTKEVWRLITKNVVYEELKACGYQEELKKITKKLDGSSISYAVLKGMHIKNLVYEKGQGKNGRIFNDIDILIDKTQVKNVDKILTELGYFKGEYSPSTNALRRFSRQEEIAFFMTSHQAPQYIKKSPFGDICINDNYIIDVNFTIFEGGKIKPKISTSELLGEMVVRKLNNGLEYKSLSMEHDLFQLLYHVYKDKQYDIKKANNEELLMANLMDIYRYVCRFNKNIDWNKFNKILQTTDFSEHLSEIVTDMGKWCDTYRLEQYMKGK